MYKKSSIVSQKWFISLNGQNTANNPSFRNTVKSIDEYDYWQFISVLKLKL